MERTNKNSSDKAEDSIDREFVLRELLKFLSFMNDGMDHVYVDGNYSDDMSLQRRRSRIRYSVYLLKLYEEKMMKEEVLNLI